MKEEFGSCVKVEVAILGSPCIIVFTVSVNVKQHERRVQELCESRGDLIVLMVSVNVKQHKRTAQELCES